MGLPGALCCSSAPGGFCFLLACVAPRRRLSCAWECGGHDRFFWAHTLCPCRGGRHGGEAGFLGWGGYVFGRHPLACAVQFDGLVRRLASGCWAGVLWLVYCCRWGEVRSSHKGRVRSTVSFQQDSPPITLQAALWRRRGVSCRQLGWRGPVVRWPSHGLVCCGPALAAQELCKGFP